MDNAPRLLRMPAKGWRQWDRHHRWGRGCSALVMDGRGCTTIPKRPLRLFVSSITFSRATVTHVGSNDLKLARWAIKSGAESRAIGDGGGHATRYQRTHGLGSGKRGLGVGF